MKTPYYALFQPIRIGPLEIKNRLVMPPVGTLLCGDDGHICDRYIDYLEARAKGGFGLIIVEGVAVTPGGRGGPKQFGIWDDSFIPEYRQLTEAVHDSGAAIALQIMHVGRNTRPEIINGAQPVAPSPIPDPIVRSLPKELSREDIKDLVEAFALAARRAKSSGFDAVEIHGGHGYLISQFMSAYANKRRDEYGGNREGFLRFPLEILQRIREVVGSYFPIIFRISGEEAVPQGRDLDESVKTSETLVASGVDALHVSVGVYESSYLTMAPPAMPQGFNASAAQAVRARVPVPVIAVGRIIDPAVAEKILSSGQADMVALGRQALADPDWPRKVKENRTEDLTKCLSCNDGCLGRAWKARAIFCVQNPALGNEAKYASLSRPRQPKKVIVAGGGPAGLEAARTAALRGHEVILYEKENTLGGQVTIAAVAPTKAELKEVITSRIKALAPLNVEIHLNEALNPSIVKTMAPEVLVVATGSEPLWPDIPGLERPGIITARDVLKGAQVGQRIIIIGGGLVGCETADFLSRQKKQVILIEMLPLLAREAAPASRYFLLGRLKNQKVQIHKATTVSRLTDNAVITSVNGEEKEALTADTVVLATGAKPVNALENALQGQVPQLYTIGDAVSPGNILQAVEQGALAAWKI